MSVTGFAHIMTMGAYISHAYYAALPDAAIHDFARLYGKSFRLDSNRVFVLLAESRILAVRPLHAKSTGGMTTMSCLTFSRVDFYGSLASFSIRRVGQ